MTLSGNCAIAGCGALTRLACCFGASLALLDCGGQPCSQTAQVSEPRAKNVAAAMLGSVCNAFDSLCLAQPSSSTPLTVCDAAVGSLLSYACTRVLSGVGVPSELRAPGLGLRHAELKSPVRVELEVHRQPRCEAAASPLDTTSAGPSAPLVMGIAGRTCEYCRQWLQDRAAREAASGAGAAAAAASPFVTHMYFSADGVPPLHAVMTDIYGEWSSVPHDAALYLLLAMDSEIRSFSLPNGRVKCESPGAAAVVRTIWWLGLCRTRAHCGTACRTH